MANTLKINFELTPENLKELKLLPKRSDAEILEAYKSDVKKYYETIEPLNDIKIITKIKVPNIKNYKYDYDKLINDLINKNILITKKELKKILDVINS